VVLTRSVELNAQERTTDMPNARAAAGQVAAGMATAPFSGPGFASLIWTPADGKGTRKVGQFDFETAARRPLGGIDALKNSSGLRGLGGPNKKWMPPR